MPGPQDPQTGEEMPELPDEVFGEQEGLSRSGSPDWGGVDLSLGDNADATGGPPTDEKGEVVG
jgi:hypothetical protein